MRINKTLVKHEWRNMKWILLYFTIVSLGVLLLFKLQLDSQYLNSLTLDSYIDPGIISRNIDGVVGLITAPFGLGILIMIFMQFKDSKSLEVGRFLKSLPISNREYYTTKLISGIVSYTVPFVIMVIGILIIRGINMNWIQDYYNISMAPEIFIKQGSVINILSKFVLCYFIMTATYTFLFMIQYLVMNITGGIVIGILTWLSPIFIVVSLETIYPEVSWKIAQNFRVEYMIMEYLQPWLYHLTPRHHIIAEIANTVGLYDGYIVSYDNIVIKTVICLVLSIAFIALSYIISKKSRVEDSDNIIVFKSVKKIFVLGVTVCSALLAGIMPRLIFGGYGEYSFIFVHIVMIIGGIIGFIISRRISNIGRK